MAAVRPESVEREVQIAKVLRPLGDAPLSLSYAKAAAKLLGVSWSTVYRLRKRFLADPLTTTAAGGMPPSQVPRLLLTITLRSALKATRTASQACRDG